MDLHTINWNDIPWTPVRDGVDRKTFHGDGATVTMHRLMPGHEPKPHSHPNEQIAFILAGTIKFFVGDKEHILKPGGLLVVPPNVVHWGEVIGDEPVLNFDVFTPKRPEYI